eukprot:14190054-Alexandrium_andersonii.AAC.1
MHVCVCVRTRWVEASGVPATTASPREFSSSDNSRVHELLSRSVFGVCRVQALPVIWPQFDTSP